MGQSALSRPADWRLLLMAARIAGPPLLLLGVMVLATLYGTASIAPGETLHILAYKLGLRLGQVTWSPQDQAIIWSIRLPRVLAAALVGAALAIAGTLFQAVLRNPLADPYVIGTSAGAQLGVALSLLLPIQFELFGFGTVQATAFAGALLTVLFVYGLARTAGRTPVVTLLLAGFVVSSFLISLTSFVMIASNRVNQVTMWTMGGIDISRFQQLAFTGPCVVLAGCLAITLAPRLDVILLGEEQAAHLGVRVERLKIGTIALAAFLTGLAVALAGVVAFVGLVVPHAVRLLYGPGHRILIPAAGIVGAAFVVVVDLIARTVVAPTEVPLGVMTAVVGAPFFLHLLRRTRRIYAL
ncbi:MAG TPA: iron ABC transporter permease [Chloroflexota bacterium]